MPIKLVSASWVPSANRDPLVARPRIHSSFELVTKEERELMKTDLQVDGEFEDRQAREQLFDLRKVVMAELLAYRISKLGSIKLEQLLSAAEVYYGQLESSGITAVGVCSDIVRDYMNVISDNLSQAELDGFMSINFVPLGDSVVSFTNSGWRQWLDVRVDLLINHRILTLREIQVAELAAESTIQECFNLGRS